jgi:OmpA family protein/List-Bact-rpt repeat protein
MSLVRIRLLTKILSALLLVLVSFAISIPANAFPEVHTVTFFENANASDSLTAFETGASPQSLTLLQDLSPSFSNVGFTFEDWNTAIDGSGIAYADGSSYSFSADVSLYAQWVAMPVAHTVTFYENVNSSDPVTAFQVSTAPQPLTLVQNIDPTFANIGHAFVVWNTAANGSGINYADGSSYSFSSDVSLFAQWVANPVVHTVTFIENANPSDTVDSFQSSSASTSLTAILNLQPAFSNAGSSFIDWNTAANGSGVSYADSSNFSFTSDMSLYAQWAEIAVVHTVTFKENVSATDSVTSNASESTPTALVLFANLQPAFSNPGSRFTGWNTAANGSGAAFSDGSTYSYSSNLNLYAQWTVNVEVHTVTFIENDNSTDTANSEMSESTTAPLTLFANLQPSFTDSDHSFSSWNTARDGSGISYLNGAQYGFSADLVLYAQWTPDTVDTLSFNANGGSGTVASISGAAGSLVTVPGQTGLIRVGFVLTSWNTIANGSGTAFRVGQLVTLAQSVKLFAQWSGHAPATLFGAVGIFKTGSSSLSANLKSQINRIANTIRSRKFRTVDLFGYTSATGLKSFNISLSRARARNVAIYLRNRLRALNVVGVSVLSSGEGAVSGQSSNSYSRVEVFGV